MLWRVFFSMNSIACLFVLWRFLFSRITSFYTRTYFLLGDEHHQYIVYLSHSSSDMVLEELSKSFRSILFLMCFYVMFHQCSVDKFLMNPLNTLYEITYHDIWNVNGMWYIFEISTYFIKSLLEKKRTLSLSLREKTCSAWKMIVAYIAVVTEIFDHCLLGSLWNLTWQTFGMELNQHKMDIQTPLIMFSFQRVPIDTITTSAL